MVILNNLVPFTSDGKCELAADEGALFFSSSRVEAGGAFMLSPLLKNFASSESDKFITQRTFFAQGFRVELASPESDVQGVLAGLGDSVTKTSVLRSFSIAPDGGIATTYANVISATVTSAVGALLSDARPFATVVARVIPFGELGGDANEGRPFDYPVEVSMPGSIRINVGSCAELPDDFEAATGNPCNPFQSPAVQCCQTAGGALLCPAKKL